MHFAIVPLLFRQNPRIRKLDREDAFTVHIRYFHNICNQLNYIYSFAFSAICLKDTDYELPVALWAKVLLHLAGKTT